MNDEETKTVVAFVEKFGPYDCPAPKLMPSGLKIFFHAVFSPFTGNIFNQGLEHGTFQQGNQPRVSIYKGIRSSISTNLIERLSTHYSRR